MDKATISAKFKEFLADYSEEKHDAIWKEHSEKFREFWAERILKKTPPDLSDIEIDDIVRFLDVNGKGHVARRDEAVARVMTPQGVWRRLFRELRKDSAIRDPINDLFHAKDDAARVRAIDELWRKNKDRKNGLTGQSGSVVNAFCVAYEPSRHLSVISLKDRRSLIDAFAIPGGPDFDSDSQGRKMVLSNTAIIDWFNSIGTPASARTMSRFFYSAAFRNEWKGESSRGYSASPSVVSDGVAVDGEQAGEAERRLFYMESQLEDFLIENWDKTELGKRFDLIYNGDELASQQYRTENPHIGTIDLLVIDKKTGQHVVIELKKGQTSDETVGQLARYMGWVEEHLTKGKSARGIIIAGDFDKRLEYALKKIKDTEVFQYRVDFKLEEFGNR